MDNSSKIHDEAREKIARDIYFEGDHFEEGTIANATWRDMPDGMRKNYLRRADQILAISGTTDIECPECEGRGKDYGTGGFDSDFAKCPKCDNGVIKHKWKVAVVLENGELPHTFNTDSPHFRTEAFRHGIEACKEKYSNAGYRQVIKKEETNGKSSSNHK